MTDTEGPGGAASRARTTVPFLAVAAVLTVLTLIGALPVWSGLVHQAALPPLGLFADVRLLTARATSYPQFVAGLAASLVLRTAVVAVVLGGGRSARTLSTRTWRRVLRLYVVAVPAALVSAALSFTGLALSYAIFVWAAIVITLAATVVLAPTVWSDAADRRRSSRPILHRRLGLVPAYLVAVIGVGALADGTAATLVATWLSALLTAVVVHRMTDVPRSDAARSRHGAVVALPLLIAPWLPVLPASPQLQVPADDAVLFVVPGVSTESGRGTMFSFDPATIGFSCDRTFYFSYAGPGDGAPQRESVCPIRSGSPYDESHSQAPLAELRRSFRQQVRRLPATAVVVTHSQGGWIAADALAHHPDLDVAALVMVAPFPVHDVGYEPPDGEPSPRRDAVRGVLGAVEVVTRTAFDPGAPLARQLLARPGEVDRIMSRPLSGVPALSITSWYDLVAMPRGWRAPRADDACPVFVAHGALPTSDTVAETITGFLRGERPRGCSVWRTGLASVAAPFSVPADPGAFSDDRRSVRSFYGGTACRARTGSDGRCSS